MLRHVVLLRLDVGTDDAAVRELVEALHSLPGSVPTIRDFCVGVDLGLAEGNAQLSVTAEFDDVAGYAAYRDHPDHVAVIEDHIRPVLVERVATQYLVQPSGTLFA